MKVVRWANVISTLLCLVIAVYVTACTPSEPGPNGPMESRENVGEAQQALGGVNEACNNNLTCNSGLTCCTIQGPILTSHTCRNLSNDEQNCGSCGHECAAETACTWASTCSGGTCLRPASKAAGTSCPDDGNPCTSDTCNGSGTCQHTNRANGTSCGTGLVCNVGACSSGCYIGGTFYASGVANPSNGCQVCTPSTSTTAWSTKADGSMCATGYVCNGGACSSGCYIGGTFYASGTTNPSNACEYCFTGGSLIAWTVKTNGTACNDGNACTTSDHCTGGVCGGTAVANGTSCGTGLVCNVGACSSGCYIGGTFYAPGVNPSNTCQICTPGTSTTGWSNQTNGTACNDGNACTTGDVCTNGACGGTPHPCLPTACQATSTCDGNGGCTVTNKTSGTACTDDGNTCTSDTCDGSGSCTHPVRTDGTSCGSGVVCSSGSCVAKCFIGGTFYDAGAVNPANACQVCTPSSSTTAWSNRANGTTCNDGNACTSGDVCNNGTCGGTAYTCTPTVCQTTSTCDGNGGCTVANRTSGTACTDDGNTCTSDTCDGSGGCTHPVRTDGTSCGSGVVCSSGSCVAKCFIGGTLYASNAVNPANACQVCTPGTSTTAWSNQTNGTICGDGSACTKNDVCNNGTCGGTPYTCTPGPCEVTSSCDGYGGCTVVPVDVDDQDSSTIDACDPESGNVTHRRCALDTSVATRLAEAAKCYYDGTNPLQKGVTGNPFDPTRVAVIKGTVSARDHSDPLVPPFALAGVKVTVVGHPEYGRVYSRHGDVDDDENDGAFEIVVNGGGPVTLRYEKSGYLSADRQVQADWQHYVAAPDVVLVPLDPQVTQVTLGELTGYQFARGSRQYDGDSPQAAGGRQATMLFPPGTTAQMHKADGTTEDLTGNIKVRATEYTVGDSGPHAMPASLPPSSAYTYAVELSVDEARDAGAVKVTFNQPIPFYVENFLNFPVGTIVPTGYYDVQKQTWVPSENGRIIKITGKDAAGRAVIDSNGQSLPGLNDDERLMLGSLYATNTTLWRTRVTHFTPWDCNWPYGPPTGACGPGTCSGGGGGSSSSSSSGGSSSSSSGDFGPKPPPNDPPDPCTRTGSIIECEAQILGERIPVVGTPFSLHYQSDRTPGRRDPYSIKIPLSEPNLPASVKRIELKVAVAGRVFTNTYSCANPGSCPADLETTFTWDGKDAFGNGLRGKQPVTIELGYVYGAVYMQPADFPQSFGVPSTISLGANRIGNELTYSRRWQHLVGAWDGRAQELGGWSLTTHHAYDPNTRTLYRGDGSRRNANNIPSTVKTVAGGVVYDPWEINEGGSALAAGINRPKALAIGPDGTIYYADDFGSYVRKVTPDGTVHTVAGNGVHDTQNVPDGVIATQAPEVASAIALGPDGSVYLASVSRVRRVLDGVSYYFAGNPGDGAWPDGTNPWAVAVGLDGSVFVGSGFRVRRVAPDGLISTVAGTGNNGNGAVVSSGVAATSVSLSTGDSSRIALAADGDLYIADTGANNALYRVTPDGKITVVRSSLEPNQVTSLAVGPDKSVYWTYRRQFSDGRWSGGVKRLSPAGDITRVAGDDSDPPKCSSYCGEGGPATAARMEPWSLAVGPDGTFYVGENFTSDPVAKARILRFAPPYPGVVANDFSVANDDGTELYLFDARGRHLSTIDTRFKVCSTNTDLACSIDAECAGSGSCINVIRYQFAYDADGRLTGITDVNGLLTTIERDSGSGAPTAIVAPFSQRTEMAVADGYLSLVRNPKNEETSMIYYSAPQTGLLHTFTEPRGLVHTFDFDNAGYLTKDADAANGYLQLTRTSTGAGYQVAITTRKGRTTTHEMSTLASGVEQRTHAGPDGATTTVQIGKDGSRTTKMADRTVITSQQTADPRFGVQAPVLASEKTVTPGGKTRIVERSRTVSLSDGTNPLSLLSVTDTTKINNKTWMSVFTKSALARKLATTSPVGRKATTLFDALGRISDVQVGDVQMGPLLLNVHYDYDAYGRLHQVTQGTRVWTYDYDEYGRLHTITDPLTHVTTLDHDPVGRVTKETRPDLKWTGLVYDADGNITSVTPPNASASPPAQSAHQFTYTDADQLSTYSPPTVAGENNWATATTWEYDYDRLLEKVTLPEPNSPFIDYVLDPASGRVSAVALPSGQGTIQYTYDDANVCSTNTSVSCASDADCGNQGTCLKHTGKLESLVGPAGVSVSRGYDGSLLTSRAWSGTGYPTCSVGMGYDNDFRVQSETVNGANSVTFGYDNDGLLTSASGSAGTMTLSRAFNGLFTGSTIGVVADSVGYQFCSANPGVACAIDSDCAGQGPCVSFGEPVSYVAKQSNSTVYAVSYVRDGLGRIVQRTETILGQSHTYYYAYDPAGRLTDVLRDPGQELVEHYEYDANGNRTAATVYGTTVSQTAYDEQDRLVTYGAKAYHFTRSGQLSQVLAGNDQWDYTYDALGNLRQVVLPDGTQIDYVVDGENHRIWKKRTTQQGTQIVQGFVYADALRVVAELDATGAVVARFVYGDGVNVPDVMIKGGVTYRIIKDHLGSPRLVVNATNGAIAQQMDYDVFGNVLNDTQPGFQPFGFAGGLYDYETKLVRFGARDYDAETGRWTAKDPLRFGGGNPNLYLYTAGDPVNYVDPDGRFIWVLLAGLATAAEEAGVGWATWEAGFGLTALATELAGARARPGDISLTKTGDVALTRNDPDFESCMETGWRVSPGECCEKLCREWVERLGKNPVCPTTGRPDQSNGFTPALVQSCKAACLNAVMP